jgi:hypothetical protein
MRAIRPNDNRQAISPIPAIAAIDEANGNEVSGPK